MKKNNMLEYLDKRLEKELGEYDFAIDWDTKKHTVEVIVVLYAHNNQSIKVADLDGVETEEDIIEFEDALLIYPKGKYTIDEEEYLTHIPYTGKKGMKKGSLDAIAHYLSQVLTQGEDDLMTFLQDETQPVFELVWEQDKFEKIEQEFLQRPQGQTDYAYPRY